MDDNRGNGYVGYDEHGNGVTDEGHDYGDEAYGYAPADPASVGDDATLGDDRPRGRMGLSNRAKGIITLAVVAIYLLAPVDGIPDALVGLGQVDDAIVFATGVATILMRLRNSRK